MRGVHGSLGQIVVFGFRSRQMRVTGGEGSILPCFSAKESLGGGKSVRRDLGGSEFISEFQFRVMS